MNGRCNSALVLSSWGWVSDLTEAVFKFVHVAGCSEFRTSEHHELLSIEVHIDNFNSFMETKIYSADRQAEQSTKVA